VHQNIRKQRNTPDVYFTKLFAVYQTMKSIEQYVRDQEMPSSKPFVTPFIIVSDSQAALKSLAQPKRQSGQFILRSILEEIENPKSRPVASVTFQ
jgi:hypothetical protein